MEAEISSHTEGASADQCAELIATLLEPSRVFTNVEAKETVDYVYENWGKDYDQFRKKFFYEISPLQLIAEYIGDQQTKIIFMNPDARFDGLIMIGNEPKIQKVELTAAIDGHNEALQMELLRERGHAPAFQVIEATGTKNNRRFGENVTRARRSEDYNRNTLLPLLSKALVRKQGRAKQNQHYTGAWLGIVFDDWSMPQEDKKRERFDPICSQALANGLDGHKPFSRVFFVGVSRRYFFDSWRASADVQHLLDTDSR